MGWTRRDFLTRTSGFVTVSALVPRWAAAGAKHFEESLGAANSHRTLVVLELNGGNDGLNTLVPYANPLYATLRSRVGIPASSVLPLNGTSGLNPVMTGIKSLWDAGRVAIVEGVGYPNSSLSHFASRDIWHTADPLLAQRNGWLGRWADAAIGSGGSPLSCAAISQALPRTLLADHVSVPSFISLATYQYQTDGAYPGDRANQIRAFLAQNAGEFEIPNTPATVSGVSVDAIVSSDLLQTVGSGYVPAGNYPAGSLGAGMQLIAQIINANLGSRILYITYGGFDNHAAQTTDHGPLLSTVSAAIKAFFDDLDGHGKSHDVLLMTWSEFGRRAQDNGSNGTDHGTASCQLVVGDAVNSGIHGDPPDLSHLDSNGNLPIASDFRAYYGTILSDWLGADSAAILGPGWENLGFLNRGYV